MAQLALTDRLDADQRTLVEALLDRVQRHDGHPALPDAKQAEVRGASEPTGFALLAMDGEELTGYLHALRPGTGSTWYLQCAVDPERRDDGLAGELVRPAVDEARRRGGDPVHWWVFRAAPDDDEVAAKLGLAPVRELVQMRRPLPHPASPRWPDDVRLRPFAPGRDDDAWLEVNRRAFADHPEQARFGLADLRARAAEPWFDPAGFLLAEDDRGLCGFCWTKVPGDGTGEIYVIGTDPRRQGEGLGRALVLAGLEHIAASGGQTATLYVDGANEPALALYRSLGFEVDHIDRVYGTER